MARRSSEQSVAVLLLVCVFGQLALGLGAAQLCLLEGTYAGTTNNGALSFNFYFNSSNCSVNVQLNNFGTMFPSDAPCDPVPYYQETQQMVVPQPSATSCYANLLSDFWITSEHFTYVGVPPPSPSTITLHVGHESLPLTLQ
jgi:hypothetical protein